MILSFGLTEQEFLSGEKTVTRRFWTRRTIAAWQKAWDEDRIIHDAVNRCLAYGGKRIGKFELTARPYLERLADMPVSDLKAEGGMVDTVEAFATFVQKPLTAEAAVIRFRKLP